jgi:glucose/arabinose dehydrogenase
MRAAITLLLTALLASAWHARAASAIEIETLAEGLVQPWALAELPDGRLLISERRGRLRVFAEGRLQESAIEGLPEVYFAGQGGLFDVLPDRDFERSGVLYLSYAAGTDAANTTTLARARLEGAALVDLRVIFAARPAKSSSAHFGGRLLQLVDGSLLLALGDGFSWREAAQDLGSHLGKIVRVSPDGSLPKDNPFIDREGALPEIYSYGHRNVQGLALDAASGTIWQHEHGPRGGDEVNRIETGVNYGWPIATRGLDYSGAEVTPFETYPGMCDPLHGWTPSIAPSALAIYRGALFPQWQDDLLVTALAGRALHRLSPRTDGGFDEEVLLEDLGERLREVHVAADGSVLLLTDGSSARLLRLRPGPRAN